MPRLSAFLLGAAILALAACTGRNSPERTIVRMGDGVSDFFHGHESARSQSRSFEIPGAVGVDVETFGGNVTVVASAAVSSVTVSIERESTHGFGRGGEGKSSLENIQATTEIVPGKLGPMLQVRVASSDPEPHFQRAHVLIEAPALADVRIRTGRGRIEVKSARGVLAEEGGGSIDVETGEGAIRLMSDGPIEGNVTAIARQGHVDFRMRGEFGAEFDAETRGGTVRVRCTDGRWTATSLENRPSRTAGRLNDGGSLVMLRTVDGDIRVAIVPDPTAVGAFIIDP